MDGDEAALPRFIKITMKILIVEDDKLQFDFINNAFSRIWAPDKPEIDRISTESDFRKKFHEIAVTNPDLIIMDVMVRWADPSPNIPVPPPEIVEQGFYRAGLRCVKMLAENEMTKNIPVIIYSVLDKSDMEDEIPNLPNVKYLDKDFDPENLKKAISSILQP